MSTTEKILQTMNSRQSGEVIAVRRKNCSEASSRPNRQCWWWLPPDIGPELESFTVNINGVHSERWSWSIVRLSRHDDAGISLIPRLCGLQHESGRGWQLRSNYVITHEECGILI